ncbi:Sugar transporter [Geosmithia morbida]|uniref:Sugar transporter n=1 Tax=Geosmithia morbida TaxID=1094350 RepID=A0A9P5D422_9HYPO|nr:Sugar transporter [Geosmithia morbida]KAF4126858.1 Sugar transporter [Geosmithia morbida]
MGRKYLGGSGESLTVWISIAASTTIIFYGYDQGVFGNVLIKKNFLETMGNPSTDDQGTMTSVYNLGCFVGALSTLYSGDKLGRPMTLMLGSTVVGIGAIIQTCSFGPAEMYVGRIIGGLGTGMNTATAGVWQSETSKMRSRGKLIIIQMANCIVGFALSNWLTLGFSFAPGSVSWRFPLAFQLFFSLVIMTMVPFLPDSPRLLIRKERHEEALEVLAALEGNGATPESPSEYAVSYTWWQLITGRGPAGVVRRMILGAWMQTMNQISGINVTSYYMTYVFINALGLDEFLARILAAAGSMDYLFFSFMAYFVIERYGRRVVMMTSATGCAICWIVIAISLGLSEHGLADKYRMGIVAVSFFFLFFACFAMGCLGGECIRPIPVPWLYPTEINALAFRSKGSSLAMASNWIMNYMVAQVTPPGIANLGYKFWIIWAVICASFVPITYLFYPETANRSLEDIDRYFYDNPGIFVFKNKQATQLSRPQIYEDADREIAAHQGASEKVVDVENSEMVEHAEKRR